MTRLALKLQDGTPIVINFDLVKYVRPGDDDDTTYVYFADGSYETVDTSYTDLSALLVQ